VGSGFEEAQEFALSTGAISAACVVVKAWVGIKCLGAIGILIRGKLGIERWISDAYRGELSAATGALVDAERLLHAWLSYQLQQQPTATAEQAAETEATIQVAAENVLQSTQSWLSLERRRLRLERKVGVGMFAAAISIAVDGLAIWFQLTAAKWLSVMLVGTAIANAFLLLLVGPLFGVAWRHGWKKD
jgi:hypothetical protein